MFILNVVFALDHGMALGQFLMIWNLLRFMLEALEASSLRFAFSRLPKVFSRAPIWSYAGLRRTLILPMQWFEYFRVTPQQPSFAQHFDRENRASTQLRAAYLTIRF